MEDILVPTGAQPFSRLILTRAEENVNFCLWREAGPAYDDLHGEVTARDNQTELNAAVTDRCTGGVYLYRRLSLLHGCLEPNIPHRPGKDLGNGKCREERFSKWIFRRQRIRKLENCRSADFAVALT
jgi:hypothetical protein